MPESSRKLIIGCGYLGQRVAELWKQHGDTVFALTRNRAAEFQSRGWQPIIGDVLEPSSLQNLPSVDTILYAIGWDRSSGRAMRDVYVQGLQNVLQALPPHGKLIYVSSTSVYGQTDGDWVSETSTTEPAEGSGQIVLDAERTLLHHRPSSVILRFAGIYGPKRLLREKALRNGEPLLGDAEKWLNLIEVRDGAQAVIAAEHSGQSGEIYNIADDMPTSRRDFYTFLAEQLGAPVAKFEPMPEGQAGYRDTHRRISNAKAKRELTWTPQYASYRDGIPASV